MLDFIAAQVQIGQRTDCEYERRDGHQFVIAHIEGLKFWQAGDFRGERGKRVVVEGQNFEVLEAAKRQWSLGSKSGPENA